VKFQPDVDLYKDHEVEEDRTKTLVSMTEKQELTMDGLRERYCNLYGYREAMHTGFIQMEVVGKYLKDHPCVALDAEAFRWAFIAEYALFSLYQRMSKLETENV
jgi:hypothetical protein